MMCRWTEIRVSFAVQRDENLVFHTHTRHPIKSTCTLAKMLIRALRRAGNGDGVLVIVVFGDILRDTGRVRDCARSARDGLFAFVFRPPHTVKMHGGGTLVDVRGRSDFSRFDPRPERPHFYTVATLVRPRGAKTFLILWSEDLFVRRRPRPDFSRFDPRPEPTLLFSNFARAAERRPFCGGALRC